MSHRFVTAGGFEEDLRNKAFSIESGSQAQCVEALYCNAKKVTPTFGFMHCTQLAQRSLF